jgi:HEAT repeats
MKAILTSKKAWTALALLAGLSALGVWQHKPILAWYYVRQLGGAYPETREGWAKKVAALEEAAVPRLLDGLRDQDAMVCANMQYPLCLLAKKWGLDDPRALSLLEQVRSRFHDFSPAGQEKVLLMLTSLLHVERGGEGGAEMQEEPPRPLPPRLTTIVGAIMIDAEKTEDLRGAALLLAAELVDCVAPGQWTDVCQEMAERGLRHAAPGARVAALQLLGRGPMRRNKDVLPKALPLLGDPEPAVRKAALVALAPETDLARDEIFLPLLHDPDDEVQFWCETVLRKRGRSDDDIQIARLISHQDPAMRIRVPNLLQRMPDLNLASWLRQLSLDPAPAVRAAAVRAAGEHPHVDFTERLREMAERDPSAAVQQIASFYLHLQTPRPARE